MKRVPYYRHAGRPGKFSGMRERASWFIHKNGGRATGAELANLLGITLIEFNRVARTITRGGLVANIVASPTWKTESGIVDRHFTMMSPPRYIAPTSGSAKIPRFTVKTILLSSDETRRKNIERAARRRRLIAAGHYIDEMEAVL